jgi:hypothetical protein
MPTKYFHFLNEDKNTQFDAPLNSQQCIHIIPRTGQQCKRRVVIGSPCCFQHCDDKYNLQIKNSTIPNAGVGIFAFNKNKQQQRKPVFKEDTMIVPYHGELINKRQLNQRYGNKTAPYAVQLSKYYEDGAIQRGIGSLANTKNKTHNNAILTYRETKPRTAQLKATKNIYHGQEILVDYGDEYRLNERGAKHSTNNYKNRLN